MTVDEVPLVVGLVVAISIFAAVVQGSLGLGFGLVASPGLTLIDPAFIPGPIVAAALVASIWTWVRDREHPIGPNFRWALIGIPIGIPTGVLLLAALPTNWLMLGLGLMVLVVAPLVSRPRLGISSTRGVLGAGGYLSAVAGTTVGLPGPTVALAYTQLPPEQMRLTLAVYLTIVQSIAISALVVAGALDAHAWSLVAVIVPGTLLGLLASDAVAKRLSVTTARRAVIAVCGAAGAVLTVRALFDIVAHS